jgi:ATP-dependent helicase/nuclease subunit B
MLHGKIDRVDLVRDGSAVAVIDYKMRDSRLELDQVYYGLSLQLLTYLLVLQASGEALFKKKVTPAAAFYARLLRSLDRIEHPAEALDPNDPVFDLQTKPRGIFDGSHLAKLDATLETGASDVVQCHVKKDGSLGDINKSDAADAEAFAALLRFVEQKIVQLADRLIAGVIEARPYRIGNSSPCPNCDFRAVCRFDPGVNRYLVLPKMKRADVLTMVSQPAGAEGGNDGA